MIISGIYGIQSKINPKRFYIGSSINIYNRWHTHIYDLNKNKHHSKKFQRHVNKYNIEDLVFTIIYECDRDHLLLIEQLFLDYYKPYFNNVNIAGSNLGFHHTQEAKDKISKSGLGKKFALGYHHTQETKNHLREKLLNRYVSTETRKKHSDALIGRPKSEEHKQNLKKPKSIETKEKLRLAAIKYYKENGTEKLKKAINECNRRKKNNS